MGRTSSVLSLLGFSLLLTLSLSPADAALRACNRTSYVLYAAAAALKGPDLAVSGWTKIVPGSCADVLKEALTGEGYFLYARSSRAHNGAPRAWQGTTNFCVKDKDFTLRSNFGGRCPADSFEAGFSQVDTHAMRSWTATFRENPDFRTMPDAAKAGERRLLADMGQRNTANDKALTAALGAFKARVHMAPNAPDAALFAALETEAMKSAVPAGYTLCNDTAGEVYAAIGQRNGAAFVSRGWWTVAGGACSHLITTPIQGQKVWLRVERGKGPPLVGGPNGFCVTTIEFDIQGRENCKKRGLMDAGFAETNQKGAPGMIARITATGLR